MSEPPTVPPEAPPTVPPEAPPPAAPAPAPAPAPAAQPNAMSNLLAGFSQAEIFIGGGALLVLLTDLVFGIFGDYSFSAVIWGASAAALVMVMLRRSMPAAAPRSYTFLLIAAVAVAVLSTVRNLILDVLFIPGRNLDVTYFLGAVGLYIGIALMALGAFRIWTGGDRSA